MDHQSRWYKEIRHGAAVARQRTQKPNFIQDHRGWRRVIIADWGNASWCSAGKVLEIPIHRNSLGYSPCCSIKRRSNLAGKSILTHTSLLSLDYQNVYGNLVANLRWEDRTAGT